MLTVFASVVCLMMMAGPAVAMPEGDPAPEGAASAATPELPRVRPYDARSAALLLQGLERSDTIRALVDRLDGRDVIVYVEMNPSLVRRKLAGTLTWQAHGGLFRYVRISLNPELTTALLIATIGHELQHAVEVAEAPDITDPASLQAHYARHGIATRGHQNGWDTIAAQQVGELVRRQLGNERTSRALETLEGFDPEEWHIVYRQARDRFAARRDRQFD